MLSSFYLLSNKFTMTQVIFGTCDISTWYKNQNFKEKEILKLDYTILVSSFMLFNFIKLDEVRKFSTFKYISNCLKQNSVGEVRKYKNTRFCKLIGGHSAL